MSPLRKDLRFRRGPETAFEVEAPIGETPVIEEHIKQHRVARNITGGCMTKIDFNDNYMQVYLLEK